MYSFTTFLLVGFLTAAILGKAFLSVDWETSAEPDQIREIWTVIVAGIVGGVSAIVSWRVLVKGYFLWRT